jgi:cystathionine beta-lyase/cystathionine gamma-synthase
MLGGLLLLITAPACETALNSGHVVSVTERVYGLKVAQATQNETPEIEIGFSSTTVVLMPTITNQTLNVPAIADTFSLDQTSTFALGIGETFASGVYQTGPDTNTTSKPIVPK